MYRPGCSRRMATGGCRGQPLRQSLVNRGDSFGKIIGGSVTRVPSSLQMFELGGVADSKLRGYAVDFNVARHSRYGVVEFTNLVLELSQVPAEAFERIGDVNMAANQPD